MDPLTQLAMIASAAEGLAAPELIREFRRAIEDMRRGVTADEALGLATAPSQRRLATRIAYKARDNEIGRALHDFNLSPEALAKALARYRLGGAWRIERALAEPPAAYRGRLHERLWWTLHHVDRAITARQIRSIAKAGSELGELISTALD